MEHTERNKRRSNIELMRLIVKLLTLVGQFMLCPLICILCFKFFANLRVHSVSWINTAAGMTLGVYLIQNSTIMRELIWNNLLHVSDWQYTSQFFVILSCISIVCVYLLGMAVDAIRIRFFEKAEIGLLERMIHE